MHRQIILDTETTGLRIEDGHRIIEIGCLEMVDRKLTGRRFHEYINPGREIEAEAVSVHGLTNEFLKDKPSFADIVQSLIDFISGAELIIHNAPFDIGFINHELSLLQQEWKMLLEYCKVVDTLQLARKIHIGQRNSLDALCKRYGVDNSKRELHGALMDAHLLAQVYLAMTGGQGSFFDTLHENTHVHTEATKNTTTKVHNYTLYVQHASDEELKEHEKYLKKMQNENSCLWLETLND